MSALDSVAPVGTVTVVGAGIVGLTTAIALLDAGFQVRVCAKAIVGSSVVSQVMAGWCHFPQSTRPLHIFLVSDCLPLH